MATAAPRFQLSRLAVPAVRPLGILHLLTTAPSWLFVSTLGLMLFHPPDFHFCLDRVAFGLLAFVVAVRICVLRQPLRLTGPVTFPLLALVLMAFFASLAHSADAETWSLFAAKWLVPLGLFHLAKHAFHENRSASAFELFSLVVLAYLTLISVAFLLGADYLIFPRYILDPGLGIHADRARGPFLQAVANGVALNLLALVAVDVFRRSKFRVPLRLSLFTAIPLAILATKTRSVWLSFAGSILLLAFVSTGRNVRRLCVSLMFTGVLVLIAALVFTDTHSSLFDRLEERSPVEFRAAVYQAGWEMFLRKPLTGWSTTAMQAELTRRISSFRQENYYFHNTYLEILVQYGLPGLALYIWVMVDLFRLGSANRFRANPPGAFLDADFRALWPIFLLVYFVNGCFVVMNYQFVNGFLFSLAGMLDAQNRRMRGASQLVCAS